MKVQFNGSLQEVIEEAKLFITSFDGEDNVQDTLGDTERASRSARDSEQTEGNEKEEPHKRGRSSSSEDGVRRNSDDELPRRGRTPPCRAGRSSDESEAPDIQGAEEGNQSGKDNQEATLGYTDEDLTKAASEAANKLSPAEVKEVLDKFNVGYVGELKGRDRIYFVESLDASIARASK